MNQNKYLCSICICCLLILIGACATSSGSSTSSRAGLSAKIASCKVGDTAVSASAQCLQDDAACYQIADGGWCTGERGSSCPTGSSALPAGAKCPGGARCFAISNALTCAISFQ